MQLPTYIMGIIVALCMTQLAAAQSCMDLSPADVANATGVLVDHCIRAPWPATDPITNPAQVNPNTTTEFRATGIGFVRLRPGFRASGMTGNNYFRARVYTGPFEVTAIEPHGFDGTVPQFEKLELGLEMPGNVTSLINAHLSGGSGINPYNPEDIDVQLQIAAPDGTFKTTFGFYYLDVARDCASETWIVDEATPFPWRIRIAPQQLGTYTGQVLVTYNDANGTTTLTSSSIEFTVVPSQNPGFLEAGTHQQQMRFSGTQESFFPMGVSVLGANTSLCSNCGACACAEDAQCTTCSDCHQLVWDNVIAEDSKLDALFASGANFDRVWLGFNSFNIAKVDLKNYTQIGPWEFDQWLEQASANDLYFRVCLENSMNWDTFGECARTWYTSPFREHVPSDNPLDFFDLTNTGVNDLFKRKLRYIISRWGYSTNVASWELINEPDLAGSMPVTTGECCQTVRIDPFPNDAIFRNKVVDWHAHMHNYIKSELQAPQMIAVSTSHQPRIQYFKDDPNIDILGFHLYSGSRDKLWGVFKAARQVRDDWAGDKLVQIDELGHHSALIERMTPVTTHNGVWATSMMGTMGSAIRYFTEAPATSHMNIFESHRQFMESIDFESQVFIPRTHPASDSDFDDLNHFPVENFYQTADDRSFAFGWLNNRYNNWYWTRSSYVNGPNQQFAPDIYGATVDGCNFSVTISNQQKVQFFNGDTQWAKLPVSAQSPLVDVDPKLHALSTITSVPAIANPNFTIEGLASTTIYDLELVDPQSNQQVATLAVASNSAGQITITLPVTLDALRPALAWKLQQSNAKRTDPFQQPAKPGSQLAVVSPNPATGIVNIVVNPDQDALVTIRNSVGQKITSTPVSDAPTVAMDVSELANGIYFVTIEGSNGVRQARLIKVSQ